MYNQKRCSVAQSIFFLMLSLCLNACGNGLTIACNLGSAPWTASSVNVANSFHLALGPVLIVYGLVEIVVNALLLRRIDIRKVFGNIVFILFFGPFVAVFTDFYTRLGITNLPIPMLIFIDLVGIILICIAVSIYQRVNLLIHPGDEMTTILRFKYLGGDPKKAQFVNFAIPMSITLITFIISKEIVAVNIGTIISFFFMGAIIGWSDKTIFPKLTHRLDF